MAAMARPIAKAGISPNFVTVAALVAALATVPLAMIEGWPGPAAACVALTMSGLLDALDGAVAVQAGRTTRVGFLLDSALDRLADAALAAALAIVVGTESAAWVAVATVGATWWLEYVRARGALAVARDEPSATPQPAPRPEVVTPGERPTRMILAGIGLGLPPLATAALWGQLVIVAASAVYLFVWSLRRLSGSALPPARPDRP